MKSRPSALVWMAAAFGAAVIVAGGVLVWKGPGPRGVGLALMMTARLGFAFFWPAYAGGALTSLFGPVFQPVRDQARLLGLMFASVLCVHLGLVAWLYWIGSPPAVRTLLIFGVGVGWTGLLVLASVEDLGRAVGPRGWWILRNIGLNYLAFLFILDFVRPQVARTAIHLAEYIPFATLAVFGPVLRLLAWLKRFAPRYRARFS